MAIGLSLLTGLLLILITPTYGGAWLAPLALTPLLFAVHGESSWKRRFLYGYAAGNLYWAVVCIWIQFVLDAHGGMGFWGGWGCFVLFSLYKALHLGVFATFAGPLMGKPWALPAVAALWTGMERTHGTLGFAWLQLGNAGIDMALPMRLAPVVGVYGLSFLFALTGTAAALAILRRPVRDFAALALLPMILLLPRLPEPVKATQTAVVLQPNVPEEAEWTVASVEALHKRLFVESLRQSLETKDARLIVWPEAPMPAYYNRDVDFHDGITRLAQTARSYLLFGGVGNTPQGAPLNSAFFVSPQGELVDRYDKMYLVPFGEFVPPLFSFVNRITQEAGDFTPGERLVLMPFLDHKIGAFICYEAAFPHLVRRFTAAGADLLVNISNDGYFGRSAAREQHLSLVRMRAAENRRWILRPTNDGISAALDPAGRVVTRLPPSRLLTAPMPFDFATTMTAYSRWGDWFAWSCLVSGLAVAALALARP